MNNKNKISKPEFLLLLMGLIFIVYNDIALTLSTSKIVSLPSLFNLNTLSGSILSQITLGAYLLYAFYLIWKINKKHKREFP
ncbi:MAG: hypothetical protein AMDU4_FER2C00237G0004 [Ferroplasma sp. Type II]|uniref:hypothetical protein n=1 Tax=Ferroplasma sp. Type II TaxID=261388 RepID=UPI0003894F56|nr:hypothetical protein [Ferroplasma sp. Type II]EQB70643.1 MAG: hypothetical protein AMDU4_FER2C00237G0004 [Ferroplasma sp. Type II]